MKSRHRIWRFRVKYPEKQVLLQLHQLLYLLFLLTELTYLQVVNMQFDGGATATLQMVAFTSKMCEREVKIYGTKVLCDQQYVYA